MRHIRSKVPANDAMPCWVVFLVELLLDVCRNVLERSKEQNAHETYVRKLKLLSQAACLHCNIQQVEHGQRLVEGGNGLS